MKKAKRFSLPANILILLSFLFLFILTRLKIDFPFTLDEAKESYTAYSLIKTGKDANGEPPGLFFRTNNDYVPTLGVYLRIPSIFLFGLTYFGVRLPAILSGFITLYIFYQVSQRIIQDQNKSILATFLFLMSPLFVQLNIFNLGITLAILFLLLALYFKFENKNKLYYLSLSFTFLASFLALPLIITILFFDFYKQSRNKQPRVINPRFSPKSLFTALLHPWTKSPRFSQSLNKKFLTGGVLVFLIFVVLLYVNSGLREFLRRRSTILDLLPSSYTHIIDKKLTFGPIHSSPLISKSFNFNRFAYNKPFFATREFFVSMAESFNFELLSSSFGSLLKILN